MVDGALNMQSILNDLRILDFTIVTAGAGATQVLADLGADVIKVEASGHFDPFRHWTALTGDVGGDDDTSSPPFRTVNRNKRALNINLKDPKGIDLLMDLIARSDVVIENFRRGVIEKMGLGFDVLRRANPKIVFASLSSQGASGPNAGFASFGSTLDGLGGLMSVTGYDEASPLWSGNKVNYPDQVVSLLAPSLVLAAVMAARKSGEAMWLDLSQREAVTSLVGDFMVLHSVTGVVPTPAGNTAHGSVEFCVPCDGTDEWLAVSIDDDEDWAALCRAIGRGDLRNELVFSNQPARRVNAGLIREAVAAWAMSRTKGSAMEELQNAGLSAAAVMKGPTLLEDPYLNNIRFFAEVAVPGSSAKERQRGLPVRMHGTAPFHVRRPAPHIGEHSAQIISDVLGLDESAIRQLIKDRIIGVYDERSQA